MRVLPKKVLPEAPRLRRPDSHMPVAVNSRKGQCACSYDICGVAINKIKLWEVTMNKVDMKMNCPVTSSFCVYCLVAGNGTW